MQFLINLAFKNLFRHKLRTIISVIAIAFSVMIVVFARGYITGMADSVSSNNIQYNSGHIKIVTEEYHQQARLMPLDCPIDGFQGEGISNMIMEIENIDNVETVIPRLKFGAMSSSGDELITMMGWGIDKDKELQYTNVDNFITEGRMVENGNLEIVMGSVLLKKLNKKVGEKVTIIYNTSYNSLKGTTFTIVGKFDCGLRILNEIVFYLPIDQAQRLLYMDGQTTELLLMTGTLGMSDKVLPNVKALFEINNSLDKYLVHSYKEENELVAYMELGKVIYNQIYIIFVLLSCIVVVNTMIMIVKERTREIGMMVAMGLESKDILYLFIIEGGIMGIFGSFIGAGLGSLINGYFAVTGIDFSEALSGISTDIMMNSYVYTAQSWSNTIFAFLLGVILVTIACIIPARKAANLEPTDAIRDA